MATRPEIEQALARAAARKKKKKKKPVAVGTARFTPKTAPKAKKKKKPVAVGTARFTPKTAPKAPKKTYAAPLATSSVTRLSPTATSVASSGKLPLYSSGWETTPKQHQEAEALALQLKIGAGKIRGKDTGKRLLTAAEIGSLAIPGTAAVRGAGLAVKGGAKLARGVKGAKKVAEAERKASAATKTTREARRAKAVTKRKGAKAKKVRKTRQAVDKAERRESQAKLRARRAKMSRGERAKDRAKSAKTRAQAGAYSRTHQALVGGTGAGGAGALAIARSSPTKRAAAKTLATESAKRAATAPRRVGAQAVRAGAAPGFLPVTGAVPSERKAANILTLPAQAAGQAAYATATDPVGMAGDTYGGVKDMLRGAPAAVQQIVTDPKGAGKAMLDDWEYRYGPLVKGQGAEFRRRMRETGGLAPLGLDALIVTPPAGRVLGAGARAGALGKKAEGFMKRDRPDLLVEAGTKAEKQAVSKNMAGVATQRVVDSSRRRATRSRTSSGLGKKAEGVAKEARDTGAVVPKFHSSIQRKRTAGAKARTRTAMLSEQGRVAGAAAREIFTMRKDQRKALKYALTFNPQSPAAARTALRKHVENVKAERAPDSNYGPLDNLPEINRMIENADKIFTPKYLEQVKKFQEIEKQIAKIDPGLNPEQAAVRRVEPQAALLGVERVRRNEKGAKKAARMELKRTTKKQDRLAQRLTAAENELEIRQRQGAKAQPDRKAAVSDTQQQLSSVNRRRRALVGQLKELESHAPLRTKHAGRYKSGKRKGEMRGKPHHRQEQVARELLDLETKATQLRGELKGLRAGGEIPAKYAGKGRRPDVGMRASHKRLSEKVLDSEVRRTGLEEAVAAIERGELPKKFRGESNDAFIARVDAARKEAGLGEGGYFKSELSRQRKFAQRTAGGQKHTAQPKAYTGSLDRLAIENLDPQIMVRGWHEGIKRRHQWEMVSSVAERNSLPWSRARDGQGITAAEAVMRMERQGIDPDTVSLINPGLLRRDFERTTAPGRARLDEKGAAGTSHNFEDFRAGLSKAIATARDVTDGPEFTTLRGWYAVPRKVVDEIEASAKTGGGVRAAQLAMSKTSGYLLAYNTGWLAFQAASTAVQAAMRGVTPIDYVAAQIWHHKQKPKNTGKRALTKRTAGNVDEVMGNRAWDEYNAWAGTGMGQEFRDIPQMGAAIPQNMVGGAVEAARYFREGRVGQGLRQMNPIQAWFRMSQIPENAARRSVAYKVLKSEGMKRMNANVKGIDATMRRIEGHFKLDPEGMVKAMSRDRGALEVMAKDLADFLGDYQAYTHVERKFMKTVVPFYSWVRFATKFALFTLPSKHPMATGLTYQLGRFQTKDLKDLLGPGMGWALGKLFLGKELTEDSPFVNMYRGNPFLSSITELNDWKDISGLLPPWFGVAMDSLAGKSIFTGKGHTVQGETTERGFTKVPIPDRLRILANSWLSMFAPYRTAQEVEHAGRPASDDSILGSPRYKRYAEGSGAIAWRRGVGEYKEQGGAGGALYRQMLPFLPQDPKSLHSLADHMNEEYEKERRNIEETRRRSPGTPQTSGDGVDFSKLFKGPSSSGSSTAGSSDFSKLFK